MTLDELKDKLILALNAEADARARWLYLKEKADKARDTYSRAYIETMNTKKSKVDEV